MNEIPELSNIPDNQPWEGLSPLQMVGIEKLMTSKTLTGAARATGVSPSTIYNWLREAPFRHALAAVVALSFSTLCLRIS